MAEHKSFDCLRFVRMNKRFALFCFVYLLGLFAGILFITQYPLSSLMRLLAYPQMSIVTGFLVSAIPFLVFYIVIRYSVDFLVIPLVFLRAFNFMYCFGGISLAYADAGWLVRFLLLFTDCFTVPLFVWYVSGTLLRKQKAQDRGIWFCFVFLLAIRCIDCSVISPFASELLSF